jgi:magnesium transporter
MITDNLLSNRTFTWYDVVEPQEEDFNTLSTKFGLPYLLAQDTLHPEHLPKYELSVEGHFLMMRSFDKESGPLATTVQELTRKIALFITDERLLTIHRVELDYTCKVADRCKKNDAPKTLQSLVHLIILGIIRTYEEPVHKLQDLYDQFETEVLSKKLEQLDTSRIYHFRRQLFVIKRILKQTNDALYRSKDFWNESPSMLQDLKENIDQVYFQLDEISDNFEHLFELHIALNDQRANDVMKVLTVFSTILLPLNFLASFYGMNFTELPGLHSWHALLFLIVVMVALSVLAIWFFRSKGWFTTARE